MLKTSVKYSEIILENIEFSRIRKNNDIKYIKLKYNNNSFIIISPQLEYSYTLHNENESTFIIKFSIDSTDFINIMNNLNERVISYIIENKNKIFNDKFTDNTIKNLFFSNIEHNDTTTYISVKTNNISLLSKLKEGIKCSIAIEVLGIWIYEEMYGLTLLFNNIQ